MVEVGNGSSQSVSWACQYHSHGTGFGGMKEGYKNKSVVYSSSVVPESYWGQAICDGGILLRKLWETNVWSYGIEDQVVVETQKLWNIC